MVDSIENLMGWLCYERQINKGKIQSSNTNKIDAEQVFLQIQEFSVLCNIQLTAIFPSMAINMTQTCFLHQIYLVGQFCDFPSSMILNALYCLNQFFFLKIVNRSCNLSKMTTIPSSVTNTPRSQLFLLDIPRYYCQIYCFSLNSKESSIT